MSQKDVTEKSLFLILGLVTCSWHCGITS